MQKNGEVKGVDKNGGIWRDRMKCTLLSRTTGRSENKVREIHDRGHKQYIRWGA